IGDLERLISKIGLQRANPREVVQLKRSLYAIANIKRIISGVDSKALQVIAEQLNICKHLTDQIENELQADPPVLVAKGNVIASGVNDELDRLRKIAFGGKDFLLEIQKREAQQTG